jgi:hypothetical protein
MGDHLGFPGSGSKEPIETGSKEWIRINISANISWLKNIVPGGRLPSRCGNIKIWAEGAKVREKKR